MLWWKKTKETGKHSQDDIIKNIINLFKLKKEDEEIKETIIRNIEKSFEQQEDGFCSNNYIDHESDGNRNKTSSIKGYHDEFKLYLKDIINNYKKSDKWKIWLTIAIIFTSSKHTDQEPVIHSKNGNIEIITYDKADKVIKEFFDLLFKGYQVGLETSLKGKDFIFYCVHLLYYKCHKVNITHAEPYINSPDWIANKE